MSVTVNLQLPHAHRLSAVEFKVSEREEAASRQCVNRRGEGQPTTRRNHDTSACGRYWKRPRSRQRTHEGGQSVRTTHGHVRTDTVSAPGQVSSNQLIAEAYSQPTSALASATSGYEASDDCRGSRPTRQVTGGASISFEVNAREPVPGNAQLFAKKESAPGGT